MHGLINTLIVLALVLPTTLALPSDSYVHGIALHRYRQHRSRQVPDEPRRRRRCTPKGSPPVDTAAPINTEKPAQTEVPAAPAPKPTSTRAAEPPKDTPKDDDKPPKDDTPKPPPEESNPPPASGDLSMLFPKGIPQSSWSTSSLFDNPIGLSDSALGATRVMSRLTHPVVTHAGKKAIQARFEKGSVALDEGPKGGFSFYAYGPDHVDLTKAKEATFGYAIYFDEGFDPNKGGKLLGFFGGDDDGSSVGCSGGRISPSCFSTRLMWREDMKGELYAYLPPRSDSRFSANNKICSYKSSYCNASYGASVGTGLWKFKKGAWNYVSQRVRLNDAGKANGQIEVFVNGRSVINLNGIILRQDGRGRIRGIQAQTFFGGHDSSWASRKNQNIYFADLSVAITERL